MLLLQNVAFLRLFHQPCGVVGVAEDRDALEPTTVTSDGSRRLSEIFSDVSDPNAVPARCWDFCASSAESLIAEARRLVFLKGNDSHDYKFSSAVLEDYYALSPDWRDRYLAMSVFKLGIR